MGVGTKSGCCVKDDENRVRRRNKRKGQVLFRMSHALPDGQQGLVGNKHLCRVKKGPVSLEVNPL